VNLRARLAALKAERLVARPPESPGRGADTPIGALPTLDCQYSTVGSVRSSPAPSASIVPFPAPWIAPTAATAAGARQTLYRDYETRSILELKKVGGWAYAAHPSTDVWCCAYAVDDGPIELWTPGQPVPEAFIEAARNPAYVVSAFNDSFETAIEQLIMGPRYGWPQIPIERHRCTRAQVLAAALPGSLEKAAEALALTNKKSDSRLMLRMAKPRKPRKGEDPNGTYWHDDMVSVAELCAYCARTRRSSER
jgi:hypothetical protein